MRNREDGTLSGELQAIRRSQWPRVIAWSVPILVVLVVVGKYAANVERPYSDAEKDTYAYQLAAVNDYEFRSPRRSTVKQIQGYLGQLSKKYDEDEDSIGDTTMVGVQAVRDEYSKWLGPLELMRGMNAIVETEISGRPGAYGKLLAIYCGYRSAGKSEDETIRWMRSRISEILSKTD